MTHKQPTTKISKITITKHQYQQPTTDIDTKNPLMTSSTMRLTVYNSGKERKERRMKRETETSPSEKRNLSKQPWIIAGVYACSTTTNPPLTSHPPITNRFCMESPKFLKHMLISLGEKTYLSLPVGGGLVPGQTRIIPMEHGVCCKEMDEQTYTEVNKFKYSLIRMFKVGGEGKWGRRDKCNGREEFTIFSFFVFLSPLVVHRNKIKKSSF